MSRFRLCDKLHMAGIVQKIGPVFVVIMISSHLAKLQSPPLSPCAFVSGSSYRLMKTSGRLFDPHPDSSMIFRSSIARSLSGPEPVNVPFT